MLTITQVPSPNSAPRTEKIRFIVLHATVGSLQSALSWLRNPKSRVSIHYLIDKDGSIYQLVDEQRVAYHAGKASWQGCTDLNAVSIGIELVNRNDGKDPYPVAQYQAASELVASICQRFQVPVDRQHVIGHSEIAPGRKSDPLGFDLYRLVVLASKILNG